MTVEAGIGAEVSVQLGQAIAGLSAQVGTLANQMAALQRKLDEQPRYIPLIAQPVTLDGSGNGTVSLSQTGPSLGYQWTLRRLSVMASTGQATSMGSGVAWFYAGTIGASETGGSGPQPQNVIWAMPTLPNATVFSSDQQVIQYGEHVVCRITGGTASQVVIVTCSYQLYRAAGFRPETEV